MWPNYYILLVNIVWKDLTKVKTFILLGHYTTCIGNIHTIRLSGINREEVGIIHSCATFKRECVCVWRNQTKWWLGFKMAALHGMNKQGYNMARDRLIYIMAAENRWMQDPESVWSIININLVVTQIVSKWIQYNNQWWTVPCLAMLCYVVCYLGPRHCYLSLKRKMLMSHVGKGRDPSVQ